MIMAPRTRATKRECLNKLDTSVSKDRPKRVSRLPTRFDDHCLSPKKLLPLQPCHASTPISKKTKAVTTGKVSKTTKTALKTKQIPDKKKYTSKKNEDSKLFSKSPDTNNNPKMDDPIKDITNRPLKSVRAVKQTSPLKEPIEVAAAPKRIINKDYSFRIFDDKALSLKDKADKHDMYEFTFDPNEEPQQKKKTRKKPVKKKPPKPKTVYILDNYNKNISKALESLKTVVNQKTGKPSAVSTQKTQIVDINKDTICSTENRNVNEIKDLSYNDNINYSPIASPTPGYPVKPSNINETRDQIRKTRNTAFISEPVNKEPLNILDELNSFDEEPVACSSMNISARQPHASPWRVEFGNLPLKWHPNAYIKPNMTPAVECSYINFNNSSKKHVYTNIVPISNDLPEITSEKEHSSNLKQSTMLDFIKEVTEKNAKKRNRSKTPLRKSDENNSKTANTSKKVATPKKLKTPNKDYTPPSDAINNGENIDTTATNNSANHNVIENVEKLDNTENFFGFDDSENQENISPKKREHHRIRSLRSRSRAVLGEINKQAVPTRAKLPLAAKNKFVPSSDAINKIFNEMKSATEAPVIDKNPKNVDTNTEEPLNNDESNDDSVHLFEDLDVIHHFHQPNRKSYGKVKKVTFQEAEATHNSSSDESPREEENNIEDMQMELDLPFHNPMIKDKKVVKAKKGMKLTKKEEQEVEEWAAAFNSMCEDVDDFPLTVE